jgi:hypothetical protein
MSGMRRKNPWPLANERKEKLDETKATICRAIMKSSRQKGYTRRQLALYLGTDKSNVSAIENRRVDRLSCNQLFRYLLNLEPNFELLISI